MASRRKQEESHLKILKDLLTQPSNKKCLECDQRGPTYVDVSIGSFVCTSCGGMLRGLNPPHRVKSISMATFTAQEIALAESHGNEWCRAVYLAKYDDQSRLKPESKSDQSKLKHFMELKYEQKRWYESPTQQRKLMENAAAASKKSNQSTSPVNKPLQSLLGSNIVNVTKPKQKSGNRVASADLLGSTSGPNTVVNDKPLGMTFGEFADFDSAFGGYPAATNVSEAKPYAPFQISSNPIPFTNTVDARTSAENPGRSSDSKSSADKYAALADLDLVFNRIEAQPSDNVTGLWQPAPMPTQPLSNPPMTGSIFPKPNQLQQTLPFTQGTVNSVNPSQPSTHDMWGPSYGEQAQRPPLVSSNPFFLTTAKHDRLLTTNSDTWNQPMQRFASLPGPQFQQLSSTNPFTVASNPVEGGNFQQAHSTNKVSNPSNPFLF